MLNFYAEDSEWPQPEPLQDFASLPGPLLGTTLELGGVRPKLSTAVAIGAGELAGKGHRTQEQMDAVFDEIVESGVFTPASVYEDVQYFYNDLGLPDDYFDRHQVRLSRHCSCRSPLPCPSRPTSGSFELFLSFWIPP